MYIFTTDATQHSIERVMERCNLKNRRAAINVIRRAIARGKCADAYNSWERNFLRRESCGCCTAVAYNNFCYILNESGSCVTVYPLPHWFGKKKRFDGKTRIRDLKKYNKVKQGWEMDEVC